MNIQISNFELWVFASVLVSRTRPIFTTFQNYYFLNRLTFVWLSSFFFFLGGGTIFVFNTKIQNSKFDREFWMLLSINTYLISKSKIRPWQGSIFYLARLFYSTPKFKIQNSTASFEFWLSINTYLISKSKIRPRQRPIFDFARFFIQYQNSKFKNRPRQLSSFKFRIFI